MIATTPRMKSDTVLAFRQFLIHTWPVLPDWLREPLHGKEALQDWLQVNWETLVEFPLGVTLLPYGDCSEGYGQGHQRIFDPEMPPTHLFLVDRAYAFHSFQTFDAGEYKMALPFDIVCAKNSAGELIFRKVQDAFIELRKIEEFFPYA